MKRAAGKGIVRLFVYLLFFSGLLAVVLFVAVGGLPRIRGILACAAWLLLFVLAEISARSSENRKLLEIDEKKRLESVGRIQALVQKVNEKARSLNDSYEGERLLLSDLSTSVAALLPSPNLDASKMEYEILTGLTRLDFLCDKAIAGTDRSGDFKKELGILSGKLRARERL